MSCKQTFIARWFHLNSSHSQGTDHKHWHRQHSTSILCNFHFWSIHGVSDDPVRLSGTIVIIAHYRSNKLNHFNGWMSINKKNIYKSVWASTGRTQKATTYVDRSSRAELVSQGRIATIHSVTYVQTRIKYFKKSSSALRATLQSH